MQPASTGEVSALKTSASLVQTDDHYLVGMSGMRLNESDSSVVIEATDQQTIELLD